MVAKLKLILEKIHWSLVIRPALLAGAWFWCPWWFSFLLALYFFLRSGPKPSRLFGVFSILMGLSLLPKWGEFQAPYTPLFLAIFIGSYALAWFLIFAIKGFFFIERAQAYFILQAIVFFLGTLYFFWQFDLNVFSLAGSLYLLGLFFLAHELFSFIGEYGRGESWLFAAVSVLLMAELCFAISLLPLGFLNGTALFFLIFCTFIYSCSDYFMNMLWPKRLFLNLAVFAVGFLVIAFFSDWKI